MIPATYHVDGVGDIPILTTFGGDMPDDGTAVVIGDESGTGSLWIDWAHHGEVDLTEATRRLPNADQDALDREAARRGVTA